MSIQNPLPRLQGLTPSMLSCILITLYRDGKAPALRGRGSFFPVCVQWLASISKKERQHSYGTDESTAIKDLE